jgi:hypothetical protein
MMAGSALDSGQAATILAGLVGPRTEANREFFARESERLARCCHRMAERFARGGRLIALGASPTARSDARHVSVEFVHPVIVGKRALPALAVTAEGGPVATRAAELIEPEDIAIGFGEGEEGGEEVTGALGRARDGGALTLGFPAPAAAESGGAAEWSFAAPGEDAFVRQEVVETAYHVLWELVHVFFDHRGLLEGREPRAEADPGAAGFLYPFLAETTSAAPPSPSPRRSAGCVATPSRTTPGASSPRRRSSARGSGAAAGCSRSATAARRPTRWTSSRTSAPTAAGAGRLAAPST